MKELLLRYAAYNIWANQRLIAVLNGLSEEQRNKDHGSSFSSLRNTVLHMWDGEAIWYQRLNLTTPVVKPSLAFEGSWEELVKGFQRQNQLLHDFVAAASEAKLAHTIEYNLPEKRTGKSAVDNSILTVFNHSTFHRGQLVTMLRQSGIAKIPPTDFIVYTRIKK